MCQFQLQLVGLALTLLVCSGYAHVAQKFCEGQCSIQRIHRMMSADCYDRTCRRIPRNLQSNIEVLDVAFNRIRSVSAEDLKPYSNLKYLYLADNMITHIQPEALSDKDSLLALDLSLNSFSSEASIPEVVFQLPSLKYLYLSQNHNINMVEVIENATPLRAPLEYLDISFNYYNDEEWSLLPIMGLMPTLIKYNVSGMSLILNTSQFAGLCNLEVWVNANMSAQFINPCDCWNLDRWLKERRIVYTNFTDQCEVKQSECDYHIPQEDMDLFTSCKKEHAEQIFQTKLNKSLLIGGCVLGIILIVVVIVLWKWRRTKVNQRKKKNQILNHEESANLNTF